VNRGFPEGLAKPFKGEFWAITEGSLRKNRGGKKPTPKGDLSLGGAPKNKGGRPQGESTLINPLRVGLLKGGHTTLREPPHIKEAGGGL